jgi:hypothetical protein
MRDILGNGTALYYWYMLSGQMPMTFELEKNIHLAIDLIVGLTCFALGRMSRRKFA